MTIMKNCVQIIDNIRDRLNGFSNQFPCVSFRFIYDELKDCVLISYEVPSYVDDNDSLWDAIASLKSNLRDAYSDIEPLFSQGDTVFKLPAEAELIECSISNDCCLDSFDTYSASQYSFSIDNDNSYFYDGYEEFLLAA